MLELDDLKARGCRSLTSDDLAAADPWLARTMLTCNCVPAAGEIKDATVAASASSFLSCAPQGLHAVVFVGTDVLNCGHVLSIILSMERYV
jgi:hypothetical protein